MELNKNEIKIILEVLEDRGFLAGDKELILLKEKLEKAYVN